MLNFRRFGKQIMLVLAMMLTAIAGVACSQAINPTDPITSSDIEIDGFFESLEESFTNQFADLGPVVDREFQFAIVIAALTQIRDVVAAVPEADWMPGASANIFGNLMGNEDFQAGFAGGVEAGMEAVSNTTYRIGGREVDLETFQAVINATKNNALAYFDYYLNGIEPVFRAVLANLPDADLTRPLTVGDFERKGVGFATLDDIDTLQFWFDDYTRSIATVEAYTAEWTEDTLFELFPELAPDESAMPNDEVNLDSIACLWGQPVSPSTFMDLIGSTKANTLAWLNYDLNTITERLMVLTSA